MRHSDTTQCTYQEHNAIVLITILSDYIILQITSYILPYIHMYGMTHQKALKTGIIAAILLVAAILTTTTTTATNAQATGYQQGKSDAQSGVNDDTCPPRLSNDETACALYKADYARGYLAWKATHDGDSERWNTDDGEFVPNEENDD